MSNLIFMGGRDYPVITDIDRLREFDLDVQRITSGLKLKTGSPFRLPSEAYANFGIGITDANRAELLQAAEDYYLRDVQERQDNEQMALLSRTNSQLHLEGTMAYRIAEIVKGGISKLDDGKREFHICEMPSAEDGRLSYSIARAISDPNLLKRIVFHLVDVDLSLLADAERNLADLKVRPTTHLVKGWHFLDLEAEQPFDFIVSLAHLNQRPFPDYLVKMYESLAETGALVSGDFHSPLWYHPANLFKLFEALGVDVRRLEQLRELFTAQLADDPDKHLIRGRTSVLHLEEELALGAHINDWCEVAWDMKERNPPGRLFLFGANDTSSDRTRKICSAGFSVDMDDVKKVFPEKSLPKRLPCRMVKNSDYAAICIGVKVPKQV